MTVTDYNEVEEVASLLHVYRALRVLSRGQVEAAAMERLRRRDPTDPQEGTTPLSEAESTLDAFRVVEAVVSRLLPLPWWDNERVQETLDDLRLFFENLPRVVEAAEGLAETVYLDPMAPGGARVRTARPGRDPNIVKWCARHAVKHPRVAEHCLPDWDASSPVPYGRIKNTRGAREAMAVILLGPPYGFDQQDVDPRSHGPLWDALNGLSRER